MPSGYKKNKIIKRRLARARTCFYCGCVLHNKNKTIDHVIPLVENGVNHNRNLVICCKECNAAKGDMSLQEFKKVKFERVQL